MAFFLCFCTYTGQTENELDMIDVNVLIKLNQSSPIIKRWHTKERQLYISCHLRGQSQANREPKRSSQKKLKE